MTDDPDFQPIVGDVVVLGPEDDCIVPAGEYLVTDVNPDGSFHCDGGNTAVWPHRVNVRVRHHFADRLIGRVVGWTVPYLLDARCVEPGEGLNAERTMWGRVISAGVGGGKDSLVVVETIHGAPQRLIISRHLINTTMPESY